MMFMMTMPPTTKASRTRMAIMAMKNVCVKFAQRERKFSLVSMAKLSGAPPELVVALGAQGRARFSLGLVHRRI